MHLDICGGILIQGQKNEVHVKDGERMFQTHLVRFAVSLISQTAQ